MLKLSGYHLKRLRILRTPSLLDRQDSDGVGGPGPLPPACNADHRVAGLEEALVLAEVDAELDAVVDILDPVLGPRLCKVQNKSCSLRSFELRHLVAQRTFVEERHDSAVELHLPGHLIEPGDRDDGAHRPETRGLGGSLAGGRDGDDGGRADVVGGLDGRHGGRGGDVHRHGGGSQDERPFKEDILQNDLNFNVFQSAGFTC